MKFNEFKRERSAEEQQLVDMMHEFNCMDKQSPAWKPLLQAIESLQYKLHRERINKEYEMRLAKTNTATITNPTQETTMENAQQIAKRLEYVDYLTVEQDYDMEELMAMPLPALRALVDSHQVKRITETYVNANGTVSRRVTERKAA